MPAPLQPDSRVVGRFHLVERLAIGGMAEIFIACEKGVHGLERLVVIKRILPDLAEDPQFVEMFLTEARISARINHQNVVKVHELGEVSGLPYMAMEYVEGSTVRQLMQAAMLEHLFIPVEVALDIAVQSCAGAHAVHELRDPQGDLYGLVHRDLTPHNLMVSDEGFVKLLDFGIVKATFQEGRTKTGVLKGKISYMSPEQCRQHELDRRSDIFALGICTWELLAGEKLFQAANEIGVMQRIISGNVRDLRKVRPDVPDPVVNALERALAPRKESRYDTADEMRRALLRAAEASDLRLDRDKTAAFVRSMLGERHDRRRKQVDAALEKTLVTFSPDAQTADTSSLTNFTQATQMSWVGAAGAMFFGMGSGILALLLLALVAFGIFKSGVLGTGEKVYVRPEGELVTFGLSPTLEREVLRTELDPLRLYLEQSLHQPVDFVVGESYSDTSKRLLDEEFAFAVLPPYIFLKTRATNPEEIVPLATKIYDGSSGFDAFILVGERSKARRVEDLVGSTICYSDPNSTTGYMWPRAYIREIGLDPDVDFVGRISGNHQQTLQDLVDGKCELGGTYSGAYTAGDQEDIAIAQLRVLAVIGRSPHDTIVAGPAADAKTAEKFKQALLSFDPSEHLGRDRVGEQEQITGFSPFNEADFADLHRALLSEGSTNPDE